MAVVGSAEYLVEAPGLTKVERDLTNFGRTVDRSMERSTRSTEKATKATKLQILGFAALGAAIGVVFIDFLRKSTVLSTMTSTLGIIFGAMADRILVNLMPAFKKLIPVLLDLSDEVAAVAGRILDDLTPAFEKAITAAGKLGDAFSDLDDDTQDLVLGIGALTAGVLLIPAHPVLGLALAFTGLILIAGPFEKAWNQQIIPALTAAYVGIDQLDEAISQFLSDTVGAPAEKALRDFAHEFQLFSANLAIDAAFLIIGVQDAWGGLVKWFEDLWGDIQLGAALGWTAISGVFTGAWQGITNLWDSAVSYFSALWTDILAAFAVPFNAMLTAAEGVINIFGDFINSTFGLIPGIPNVPRIELPRLEHGGEVLKTGLAVVHEGEQYSSALAVVHEGERYSSAGSAPAVTVQVLIGAGALTSLALPESTSGLEDLFGALGQMAGERAATVLRRRD